MTSKDEHSDSPQSYSRGWNQPRSDSTQEIPATPDNAASNPQQGPCGPYGAQPQGSQGPSQGPAQVPRQQPGAQYYGQQTGSQPFGAQQTGAQPVGVPGVDDGETKTSKSKRTVGLGTDRKSTRLNSSHVAISYAV